MCHFGTLLRCSQGKPVMRSFLKMSAVISTTALIAVMTLPANALAVELSSSSPSHGDKVSLIHNSFGKEVVISSDISINELKEMRDTVRDQSRQIEELKRSSGSSSSSSGKEIEELKNKVKEQDREIETLGRQVEELKRNSGSSSNSNSSEISSLKQKINDQDRAMDQFKRTVEDLSRKVK
jgi:predicted RNase H-like nuclease (RuvC/YqgF family)